MSSLNSLSPPDETPLCPHCQKPPAICVCDVAEPVETKTTLLILQHPQEQDRLLGTARIVTKQLPNSALKIGLSWPSLAKALGRDAHPPQWAILHLGSAQAADFPPGRDVVALDAKGAPLPDQDDALRGIRGVVIFDGSWSQAKTLWWRNPWVLKARRLALNPPQPSAYGKLRKEPRREGLSTIEAAAMVLSRLENNADVGKALRRSFNTMLQRYRDGAAAGVVTPERVAKAPAPRRDLRRKKGPTPPRGEQRGT